MICPFPAHQNTGIVTQRARPVTKLHREWKRHTRSIEIDDCDREMKYEDILHELAPCGLNCRKCVAFRDGDIRKTSEQMQRLLGSFDLYAERFSRFAPVFVNYPAFKELLAHFAQADCRGCRSGQCRYPNCGVMACHTDKGVDFCFQCDEFPCDKTNFDPDLKRRWMQMGSRMKEVGVEAYHEETKDAPRYK